MSLPSALINPLFWLDCEFSAKPGVLVVLLQAHTGWSQKQQDQLRCGTPDVTAAESSLYHVQSVYVAVRNATELEYDYTEAQFYQSVYSCIDVPYYDNSTGV